MTAHELARTIIKDILAETGITATVGIGTNLYLCKVAMDIVAKHVSPDADGVRIAELDEMSYRQQLWDYTPLTDFWRVGRGIAQRLAPYGIDTMGKLARLSLQHEDLLYKLFGVNAELIIDHAWGWEPCTMQAIKAYRPASQSFSSGQVLTSPTPAVQARIVVQEMADAMSLKLVRGDLVTNQLTLSVNYDVSNLTDTALHSSYKGQIKSDYYGRLTPAPAHGSISLDNYTSSAHTLIRFTATLFDRIAEPSLLIRRLTLTVMNVQPRQNMPPVQLSLFDTLTGQPAPPPTDKAKEQSVQETLLKIKEKFGKNAILRGLNFEEGATARVRNEQIGGHKA